MIQKYSTFYLNGDFYSRKVLNMTIWQSVLGTLSLLFSDQLTRPQLGLCKLLKNTSRTILMGMFQLSLGKKMITWDQSVQQVFWLKTSHIILSNRAFVGKRPYRIPWTWSYCWNHSHLKPFYHHAKKLQLLKGQKWPYNDLDRLMIVRKLKTVVIL